MKIGLLHIQSNTYPLATYDFAEGVEIAFRDFFPEMPIEIVAEEAKAGTEAELVQEKSLKLLAQHKCKALLSLAENNPSIATFGQVSEMTGKPVIISGWGGILGIPSAGLNKHVYYNGLGLCESSYLAARYMARKHEKIMVITSYYEGGYPITYSFYEGLMEVTDREPYIYSIKDTREPDTLPNFLAYFQQVQPDALFVMLSHKDAERFAAFWEQAVPEKVPLFTTYPFAQRMFAKADAPYLSELYYLSTFQQFVRDEAYQAFESRCLDKEVSPSEYTLLGYENGQLLGNILAGKREQAIMIQSIREGTCLAPEQYRLSCKHSLYHSRLKDGVYKHEKIQSFEESDFDQVVIGAQGKAFTQWLNPYLFV